MNIKSVQEPFNLILFGASGDLAQLKLFPSIYELYAQNRFPKKFIICGYARSTFTDKTFRQLVQKSITKNLGRKPDLKILSHLLEHMVYQEGQYDSKKDYAKLAHKLFRLQKNKNVLNMAYFAIPPAVFKPVIENFAGTQKILGEKLKIILEKPFGDSEKSATELFHFISRYFKAGDIFLLDHYLGKSPVQSILPLRYHNTILNILLSGGREIKNIQISALEQTGVESRISFFESVGIVKDMIQSHLLQVLALFTMSLPYRRNSENIRREKHHILSALQHANDSCGIVMGQYKSYKKQKGVKKDSKTPTFAAIRLFIDLMDWFKVPVYIRAGKNLNHKHTYVVVEFRKPPFFRKNENIDANRLIIEMFPEEKTQIRLVNEKGSSVPNEAISTGSLACDEDVCLPDYGRLILDAFLDDQTFFLGFEEIIASWGVIDRLMGCAEKFKAPVRLYKDGSEGPKAQHLLTAMDQNEWYDVDYKHQPA